MIGKVDIQKVLLTINQGKKVRAKLKKAFDKKQKSLKSEEEAIRKMQKDFEKQQSILSEKAKVKKQKDIQMKIVAIQQKSRQFQGEIQKMEQSLKKPILEKVRAVIDTVSKDSGVDLTFEISTAPIVYAKHSKDLTGSVIKAYNKKHK